MRPSQAPHDARISVFAVALAALGASLAILALSAVPAFAERSYDSQITGFTNPWAVTVDPGGHVWVSDTGNNGLVSEYSTFPSQTLLSQQDGEGRFSGCGGLYIQSLAVNSTNDSLYVVQNCAISVLVFDPSGHFVNPKWNGFYVAGIHVAIDNSGGPANGRVYVANRLGLDIHGYVKAFDPDHHEVNFEASVPYVTGSEITGTPAGGFGYQGVQNVAVDDNGNIYVVETVSKQVFEYEASGRYVQAFTGAGAPGGPFGAPTGVAVDPTTENVLIVDSGKAAVDEFSPTGEYLGRLTGISLSKSFGELNGGIAVNSDGYVYVADTGLGVVDIFTPKAVLPRVVYTLPSNPTPTTETLKADIDPHGGGPVTGCHFEYGTDGSYGLGSVPCTPDPASSPPGSNFTEDTAVTASVSGLTSETRYHYRVVVSNASGTSNGQGKEFTPHWVPDLTTEAATAVEDTSATLHGSFTGNGDETEYYFQYGTDTNYGQATPIEKNNSKAGPQLVTPAVLTGLQPHTTYHFRLVATNTLGTTHGQDQAFTTAEKPTISTISTSGVTTTGADLHADINPHGGDTHYYFEYGTSPAYGSTAPMPAEDMGSSQDTQAVTAHIENLQPAATYHFRAVAENPFGVTVSEDQAFGFYPPACPNAHIRQQTSSAFLPDCRAYELVSPGDAGGTTIYPLGPNSAQATNPPRFGFGGFLGTIPEAGDPPNDVGDFYLATRTERGWITKYVGIPITVAHLVDGPPGEPNLGYFLINSPAGVRASLNMDKVLDWDDGNEVNEYYEGPTYGPKYTPHLWAADGSSLGTWPTIPGYSAGPILNQSPDFTHYYFESEGIVYDNNTVTNTISLIAQETDGTPIPVYGVPQTSTDGSHVLMSTAGCYVPAVNTCGPGELFMRVDDSITYDIAKSHVVKFVGMTKDADKVYFKSEEQLTSDDQDTSTDLYMWSEAGETNGTPLTLVSIGQENRGNSDECSASWTAQCGIATFENRNSYEVHFSRGQLGGNGLSDNFIASSSGDIYFYSPEQLVRGKGVKEQANLYLYRNGQLQYVTTFDPTSTICEEREGQAAPESCSPGPMSRVQVSPDGAHMAFLTASRVTDYRNSGHAEMYSYDPSTGEVRCVSCKPGGESPRSDVWPSSNGTFMSDDGRTFFSTADALVPRDTDDLRDVYEFVEGRPQLISSGTSSKDLSRGIAAGFNEHLFYSGLVGVSADGANVYFATYDTLVGQDRNGPNLKFYDARSDGGFPFVAPSAPCAAADECVGPGSSPPILQQHASRAELGSGGNIEPKKRRRGKKRHHKAKGHRNTQHTGRVRNG